MTDKQTPKRRDCTIGFCVTKDVFDEIKEACEADDIPVSQFVREAIRQWLRDRPRERAA